jgi:phage protein D
MAQGPHKNVAVEVTVDGKTAFKSQTPKGQEDTRTGVHILRLSVDKRLDCPDKFEVDYNLVVRNALTFVDSLKEGQEVKIKIGYGSTNDAKVIFTGEVAYVEPHFDTQGHSTMTISGYDRSHRLTRGSRSKTWDDKTTDTFDYPGVSSDVVNLSGNWDQSSSDELSISADGDGPPKFRNVPQLNMNDYTFIKSMGMDLGIKQEVDSETGRQITFRKVDLGSPKVTIVRDKPEGGGTNSHIAKDIRFRLSTVKQVSRVEVRGWDPQKKKNIVGVAESASMQFEGTTGPDATAKALYGGGKGRKIVITDHPVKDQEEAKRVAQSVMDKLAMDFVTGEAEIEGEPTLAPGDMIECQGFGKRFDGKYLVTACQHVFVPEVLPYVVRLEFQRNSINEG